MNTTSKIKAERIRLGLTQEQLSNVTSVPVRTIQNWEEGIRSCPAYVESMILDKLHATFDEPDYKTAIEEILDMLERDLKHIQCEETKRYVTNVIDEINDALK